MNLEQLCELLKEAGVMEVILIIEGDIPKIEFNGRHQANYFKIVATNADFSEHGL